MTLPTRLRVLMLLAVLGVLVLGGLVVGALAGAVGVTAYAVLAVALLVTGGVLGRRALARVEAEPLPAGRSCTCCTTSQFDPVEVV